MKPIQDLHRVPEDDRIKIIGEHARTKLTAVLVDSEPEKVARYIQKVLERFPGVRLVDQSDGPTPGVTFLRFAPKVSN